VVPYLLTPFDLSHLNIQNNADSFFNYHNVNEKRKTKFVIHSRECKCRNIKTNRNGFWTECYEKYADAEKSLRRLIEKFRDSDFEIAPCEKCC
jgi:hypothetical protein